MVDKDAIVDLAIERASLEVREAAEADRWAAAAIDPEFRQEMADIERDLRGAETPPE